MPSKTKCAGPDMLTPKYVKELAEAMSANEMTLFEVKRKDYSVRLVRAPGARPLSVEATGLRPARMQALSPATGPFLQRGGDDGTGVLERGATVVAGEPLGYVGFGPVRLLCVSPAAGRLVGRLPSPGKPVTVGDPLFTVEPGT